MRVVVDQLPPDHAWDDAAVLCALYSTRELSRMCLARGLPATGPTKRSLAERIVTAPPDAQDLLAERRRAGLPLM